MRDLQEVLNESIRRIPDFPKAGITYFDITTILLDPLLFKRCVYAMAERYSGSSVDRILAVESRGFLFGAPLAQLLGVPLIPVRKAGKLPAAVEAVSYVLEYGEDHLEVHSDAIPDDSQVLIVDDLIATGGTLEASIQLTERLGAQVVECAAVIELTNLGARKRISPTPIFSLIEFEVEE